MKNKLILGIIAVLVLFAGTVLAGSYFYDFNGPGMHEVNGTSITEHFEFRGMRNEGRFFNGTINDTFAIVKQKLGLPSNASKGEIKTALDSWAQQNRELLWALGPGMPMHRTNKRW